MRYSVHIWYVFPWRSCVLMCEGNDECISEGGGGCIMFHKQVLLICFWHWNYSPFWLCQLGMVRKLEFTYHSDPLNVEYLHLASVCTEGEIFVVIRDNYCNYLRYYRFIVNGLHHLYFAESGKWLFLFIYVTKEL